MAQTQVQTRQITMTQALNEAMREEMRRDVRVFIMGEDIQKEYMAPPVGWLQSSGQSGCGIVLSENAFFGAAVGAAAVGTRPIVESAFCFSWVAMDSLVSQAAKCAICSGTGESAHRLPVALLWWEHGGAPFGSPHFITCHASRWCSPAMPMTPKGC